MESGHPPSEETFRQLRLTCGEALRISREIFDCLQQGVSAPALEPLLRREARLAGRMQAEIRRLGRHPLPSSQKEEHARLVEQFEYLIEQERENHQMFTRRGVRLSGGACRHHPGKRGGR